MSIESEILRIQKNIADTYGAVADMGGNVPLDPSSENLAKAVRSIPVDASTGDGNPIGTVISFMGNSAPNGYLACEGGVFNVSSYPELSEFFREQFGKVNYFGGNGTTTFAVPDMRNLFLRGYHGSATALSGDVGKKQEGTNIPSFQVVRGSDGTWVAFGHPTQNLASTTSIADIANADSKTTLGAAGYVIVEETSERSYATYTSRPVNMAVLYCIKAAS